MEPRNEKDKLKLVLAAHLGLEPGDIKDDDSIADDLHMTPTDFSDLMTTLEDKGYDVSKVKLTEIENVEDLVDSIFG